MIGCFERGINVARTWGGGGERKYWEWGSCLPVATMFNRIEFDYYVKECEYQYEEVMTS